MFSWDRGIVLFVFVDFQKLDGIPIHNVTASLRKYKIS